MAIDRRNLLVHGAVLLASTVVPLRSACSATKLRYITAAKRGNGQFCLLVLTEDGAIEQEIILTGRGHDIALSPDARTAIAFARRPGNFAVVIDLLNKRPPLPLSAAAGRHFYGHGVFSPDGHLLYATENDYDAARGVLGVYDVVAGYRRIGELDTHGVGPHDILLMPDGETLCIANGGIETHPDAGRAKLNLDTMRPSLAFIDRQTGDLKQRHELARELHHLSIRHLCIDGSGAVWFGGQWEGGPDNVPWVVGYARIDRPIVFSEAAAATGTSLKGYIGSMAASADGAIVAASAPRSGRVVYFDAVHGDVVGERTLNDVCGVAPAHGSEIAHTSGEGYLQIAAPLHRDGDGVLHRLSEIAFDNHMRTIRL